MWPQSPCTKGPMLTHLGDSLLGTELVDQLEGQLTVAGLGQLYNLNKKVFVLNYI